MRTTTPLNRRQLLRLSSTAIATSLLAACNVATPAPTLPATPQTTATPTVPSPTAVPATATVAPGATSEAASRYLQAALDYIQQHSVMRNAVDWPHLRGDAAAQVRGAQTTADTYPAIRDALQQLGDHHSSFFTPAQWRDLQQGSASGLGFVNRGPVIIEVFPGSPADRAGLRVRDVIAAINHTPVASLPAIQLQNVASAATAILTLQHEGDPALSTVTLTAAAYDPHRPPQGRSLTEAIGYLELPAFSGPSQRGSAYATAAQQAIRAADGPRVRGWIVDVRLNTGGGMYPMLAGMGPILGDGDAGGFVDAAGATTWFGYRDGAASLAGQALAATEGPAYRLLLPMPPVAVLTDARTASSGEAVVVAFRGRPAARSFGAATAGVPTANQAKQLEDGAVINLTTARDCDRTGRTYDAPIPPDEPVAMDWSLLDSGRDPVIAAATRWLSSGP